MLSTEIYEPDPTRVFPELTDREGEVLELAAASLGNHEIARRLVLSDRRSATTSRPSWSSSRSPTAPVQWPRARDAGLGTNSQQRKVDPS
jgi:hypothetical protein